MLYNKELQFTNVYNIQILFRDLRVQLAVVQEEVRLVRSEVYIWRQEAERSLSIKEEEEQEQVRLVVEQQRCNNVTKLHITSPF